MPGLEVGIVCIKTVGREAGKKAVIVALEKDGRFAVVDGNGIKRRKCNVLHLLLTKEKIKIKSNASTKEVLKALK